MAYPTEAALKSYIGTSGTDGNLAIALSAAIAQFEKVTRRVFVAASATRSFNVRDYVTMRGRRLNFYADLYSITSLTNGDGIVVDSGDYVLEPIGAPYYEAWLTPDSGLVFWDGGNGGRIAVAGSWGYSADVPGDVNLAILQLAKFYFDASKQGTGGVVQSTGRQSGLNVVPQVWPEYVRQIAETYRRVAV